MPWNWICATVYKQSKFNQPDVLHNICIICLNIILISLIQFWNILMWWYIFTVQFSKCMHHNITLQHFCLYVFNSMHLEKFQNMRHSIYLLLYSILLDIYTKILVLFVFSNTTKLDTVVILLHMHVYLFNFIYFIWCFTAIKKGKGYLPFHLDYSCFNTE